MWRRGREGGRVLIRRGGGREGKERKGKGREFQHVIVEARVFIISFSISVIINNIIFKK